MPKRKAPKAESKGEITLTLRKNHWVRGVLFPAGKSFPFPEAEAKRRLRTTNGIWSS